MESTGLGDDGRETTPSPNIGHRIFISFGSDETATAEKIVESLDALGFKCFYAPRDVDGGMNFAVWTVRAIAACDAVLVLLSANAISSPHVRREVTLAIDERRYILPLTVGDTKYPYDFPPEWTYWLSAVQVAEFIDVRRTVAQISAMLERLPQAPKASVSAPHSTRTSPHAVKRSPLKPQATPSTLLRAELDTVPLIGRAEEMARLEQWAVRDADFDTRVLIGAAGQGKTRLARTLGRHLSSRGWHMETLPTGTSGRSVALALRQAPTLLVIDYAETRSRQIGDFLEGIAELGLSGKLRLLLLARSAGDWWKALAARSDIVHELLDDAVVQVLSPLIDDREVATALYRRAYNAFGDALGIEGIGTAAVPYRNFSSVLDLLAAALDNVLSGSAGPSSNTSRLLSHERRYIAAAVSAAAVDALDSVDLDRIAAAFTLFGAGDERAAIHLLEEVDAELEPLQRRKMARVFRSLYPGAHFYIEGLRPDALAEDLVAQTVQDDGALPGGGAMWRSQSRTPEQLHRGLTILARSAARHSPVAPELARVVQGADPQLIATAIEVATQIEDSTVLVRNLTEVIDERRDLDAGGLLELIPDETVNLAGLAAQLAARVMDDLPALPDTNADGVERMIACSNRFSDAGWGRRAVDSIRLAVERLDQLSGKRIRHIKGRALLNLSNRLWETGYIEESVPPAQRAVDELTTVAFGSFELAAAWNNLAFRLSETGKFEAALSAVQKAYAALTSGHMPDERATQTGLGAALNNLACIYFALGQFDDAASCGRDAVALRRAQALQDRDRYLPYVARTLANAAPAAMAAGAPSAGLSMIGEARALHAITGPRAPIFTFEQAESATIHAAMLMVAGDQRAANSALEEAARLLSTPDAELNELTAKLALTIEKLTRLARDQPLITWSDFTAPPSPFIRLPQLLEYKDI